MQDLAGKLGTPPAAARRFLHWLTAVLVLFLIVVGLVMTRVEPSTPDMAVQLFATFSLHKTIGVVVLLITALRLAAMVLWPMQTGNHASHEVFASSAVQIVLILALIGMPLTGLAQSAYLDGDAPVWFFPTDWFKQDASPKLAVMFGKMHHYLGYLVIACLLAHVAGALKHHFIDRDSTLTSMLNGREALAPTSNHTPARIGRLAGLAAVIAVVSSVVVIDRMGTSTASIAAGTGEWRMIAEESDLRISAIQNGNPMSAQFDIFEADITLDPDALGDASITVRIDSTSFLSGVPDVDGTAVGPDWLDSENFPIATWQSQTVTRTDDGRYIATGDLTIREVSAPVDLVFSLTIDGDNALAEGDAVFDRREVDLGRGMSGSEQSAGFEIGVSFTIRATK
ncbi:MAG: cytochrome b/b6 domain-containing protein, partial [Pseudomonadota bacterium]